MTPSKDQQRQEGEERLKTGVPAGETADALDVVADSTTPDDLAAAPPARANEDGGERRPITPRSLSDAKRNAIVGRFQKQRNDDREADTDAEEIRAFAFAGLPPELAVPAQAAPAAADPGDDTVEAEAAPEPVADATPPAAKRKLLVRGKEVELTEDELIAAAQKSLAGDDYLGEAKETARAITEEARAFRDTLLAARAAVPAKHPGEQNDALSDEPISDQTQDGEHPADPFVKAVNEIQFGDPAKAAKELRQVVVAEAAKMSREAVVTDKWADETAKSNRFLADFKAKHSDLANDPRASAVIEREIYDLQVEDLRKIGLRDDQLPQTPVEISNWHKHYRAHGQPIRSALDLLETATDRFMDWKGVKKPDATAEPQPEQQQQPDKTPPRVAVQIDRSARRANVPQQPTRTGVPRPDAATQQPAPRDRSDVVQQMMIQRGKPRGKVIAA